MNHEISETEEWYANYSISYVRLKFFALIKTQQ